MQQTCRLRSLRPTCRSRGHYQVNEICSHVTENYATIKSVRQQTLGFIMWFWPPWRPSWISRLAQTFSLAIRLIFFMEVLMMQNPP